MVARVRNAIVCTAKLSERALGLGLCQIGLSKAIPGYGQQLERSWDCFGCIHPTAGTGKVHEIVWAAHAGWSQCPGIFPDLFSSLFRCRPEAMLAFEISCLLACDIPCLPLFQTRASHKTILLPHCSSTFGSSRCASLLMLLCTTLSCFQQLYFSPVCHLRMAGVQGAEVVRPPWHL